MPPQATLTDTGPIVALLAEPGTDAGTLAARRALPLIALPMLIPLPCFTEAMYLLGKGGYDAQTRLWAWYLSGAIRIHLPTAAEVERARLLTEIYADIPCDFADAILLAVAESLSIRRIFTLDSHFYAYRLADGSALEVLPGSDFATSTTKTRRFAL